ncbi:hypothetical protein PENTCL1PPCAC_13919, partial [Pristionchus entomophagus]
SETEEEKMESIDQEEKVPEEKESQGDIPSPAPICRWTAKSTVDQDQDEDNRSLDNEYFEWLTREDPKTRGDSMDGASSDCGSESVPLPSTLPVPSWGAGIQ